MVSSSFEHTSNVTRAALPASWRQKICQSLWERGIWAYREGSHHGTTQTPSHLHCPCCHWNRLPTEVVMPPSSAGYKEHLDNIHDSYDFILGSLEETGGLDLMILMGPSQPEIFCDSVTRVPRSTEDGSPKEGLIIIFCTQMLCRIYVFLVWSHFFQSQVHWQS